MLREIWDISEFVRELTLDGSDLFLVVSVDLLDMELVERSGLDFGGTAPFIDALTSSD